MVRIPDEQLISLALDKTAREISEITGYTLGNVNKRLANLDIKPRPYQTKHGHLTNRVEKIECSVHGLVDHYLRDNKGRRNGYRCFQCGNEYQQLKGLKKKSILIQENGGSCLLCGYSKCLASLDFHHRDPATKLFRVGGAYSRSLNSLREEVSKCDLLCRNCHTELHYSQGDGRPRIYD